MLDSNLDMCKAIDIDLISDTSNSTKLQILLSISLTHLYFIFENIKYKKKKIHLN